MVRSGAASGSLSLERAAAVAMLPVLCTGVGAIGYGHSEAGLLVLHLLLATAAYLGAPVCAKWGARRARHGGAAIVPALAVLWASGLANLLPYPTLWAGAAASGMLLAAVATWTMTPWSPEARRPVRRGTVVLVSLFASTPVVLGNLARCAR